MSSNRRSRILLAIVPFVIALIVLHQPQPTTAELRVGLRWGSCTEQLASQYFEGPRVYRQVIIGKGFTEPNRGHRFTVTLFIPWSGIPWPVPDAWRFDDGGCQSGRLSVRSSDLSSACSEMGATGRIDSVRVELWDPGPFGGHTPWELRIHLKTTYDLFTPDPETSYTLWEILYDHQESVEGVAPPDSCAFVESELVFLVAGALIDESLVEDPISIDCASGVWWNYESNCLTQAEGTTWGRVKSYFR